MRGWGVGVGVLVVVAGCGPAEGPPRGELSLEGLAGTWEARLEHDGQEGRIALEFAADEALGMITILSLPDIDVWDVPAWPASLEDGVVHAGPMTLEYDPATGHLRGVVPASLAPVHRIPMELRRVDALERPEQSETPALPEREPQWTFEAAAAVWAGLAYRDGVVYAGDDAGVVHALDAAGGRERWHYATSGAIRATPVVDGRTLLVHSGDGYLYRLDLGDGSLVRRLPLGPPARRVGPEDPAYRYDGYAAAAAPAGSAIYVSHADGPLLALDAATGERLWEYAAGDEITSTPLVRDGTVFVGSFDGRVLALDAGSGALRWEHDTGAPVPSSPAWHDGKVLIGSRSYDLMALDARDGAPVWNHYLWFSWVESSVTVDAGVAYVGSSDAQMLHAIDAGSGHLLWRFDTGGSAWAKPAVSDDAVFIGSVGVADYMVDHRGGFYAVDRRSGRGLWRFAAERPGTARNWGFAAAPALGPEQVFAAGLDGRIHAFSRR